MDTVFLEHGCADWIVDTCQNGWDIKDAFGNLACHNVAVIAIRDGNKCIRAFDTGLAQDIHVGPRTNEALALERCAKPSEGVRGAVDDGYVVRCTKEAGYR